MIILTIGLDRGDVAGKEAKDATGEGSSALHQITKLPNPFVFLFYSFVNFVVKHQFFISASPSALLSPAGIYK